MSQLLLASCKDQIVHGYPQAPDDQIVLTALAQRGISAQVVAWDDPTVSWTGSTVLIRSTWDYDQQLRAFLSWGSSVAKQGCLWNPLPAVWWNIHKSYLRALAHRGIPTIPTYWLAQGAQPNLPRLMEQRGWQQVIIKPAVTLNGSGCLQINAPDQYAVGQVHLDTLLQNQDVLVQPFLKTIREQGERSLIWINNQWSRCAIRKYAVRRSTDGMPGNEEVFPAGEDELLLADQTLRCALELMGVPREELLFARVDLVRDEQGQLRLMELKVIEPILYLTFLPNAAKRLVDAIVQRVQRPPETVLRSTESLSTHPAAMASTISPVVQCH